MSNSASIANCYNTGDVEGYGYYAGGIIGYIYSSSNKVTNCYSAGSVKASSYVGGIYGYRNYSSAVVTNNYVLSDSAANENGGTFATAEEFASGKITYLLNNSAVVGYDWYQTLGSDTYPVFDNSHALVWRNCDSTLTNDSAALTHHFVNGVCSVCGAIDEVPALVDGWYLIDNHHKLYWFANKVNSGSTTINGKLTADIVVNENVLTADGSLNGDGSNFTAWTPIGTESCKYAGTFDGQGHTVSGLYFNNTSTLYVGLFGYVTGGTISNVGVVDSYIRANEYVGAVVGRLYNGTSTITNCFNEATIYTTNNSYAFAGGIAGHAYGSSSTITNCYNKGKITGSGEYTGGICGILESSASLSNCFNVGSVTSTTTSYLASIAPRWSNGGAVNNSYYLEGTSAVAGNGNSATAEEFASGQVAYALNGSVNGGSAWFQNLSSPVDSLPVLDATHGKVWRGCGGVLVNDPDDAPHHFVKGRCTVCGEYIEPTFADGWYEIANIGNLYWFAQKVNSGSTSIKAKLVADIVVNDSVLDAEGNLYGPDSIYTAWTPIGTNNYKFAGTFDGQGHTVSGLYFNNTTGSNYPSGGTYVGLFGYVRGGTVSNIGLVDSYIHGYSYTGGIVGLFENGTLSNCYNTATVVGQGSYIGGICGIFGLNNTLSNCFNSGKIHGSAGYVGSVYGVAWNNGTTTTSNCYYLEGTATDGSNIVQFGVGNSSKGYTTADVEGCTTAATAEEFASGKIAYLLNGSVNGGSAWFQNLSSPVDSLPVLDATHGKVWLRCDSVFTNEGAHKADSIVKENVVAATYTTAGSYDSVVYCSVCHVELSRTTIEVPMLIAAAQKIELKSMPKVEYVAGEKLDVSGAVVVVTFSNGTTKEIALSAAMVSGFDAKKVGEQKLTVTYTVDGVTLTTTFTVKVEKNTAVDDEAVAEVSIYAINRTIVVETAEPAAGYIFVFDANGRLVAKELATSNRTEIAMTRQGLYIVRIGDKAERVVVY